MTRRTERFELRLTPEENRAQIKRRKFEQFIDMVDVI